jgi:hypothetical protein
MGSTIDFNGIGYAEFQRMAVEPGLSRYEKIGFPDSYRAGFEAAIFSDIRSKLTNLDQTERRVLDIGPGCSDLPLSLIDLCRERGHHLSLIDGAEMLSQLPDGDGISKVPGFYPDCPEFIDRNRGEIDAILCYSVLHYIFTETPLYRFVDRSLSLLAPGGQMLIGDIPNISKRKRFFASDTGIRFHREFMNTDDAPEVHFNQIEHDQIDDAVILSIAQRARAAGFDAYVVPQRADLPMANRREDVLIMRP